MEFPYKIKQKNSEYQEFIMRDLSEDEAVKASATEFDHSSYYWCGDIWEQKDANEFLPTIDGVPEDELVERVVFWHEVFAQLYIHFREQDSPKYEETKEQNGDTIRTELPPLNWEQHFHSHRRMGIFGFVLIPTTETEHGTYSPAVFAPALFVPHKPCCFVRFNEQYCFACSNKLRYFVRSAAWFVPTNQAASFVSTNQAT
jgi:hypothetical protein